MHKCYCAAVGYSGLLLSAHKVQSRLSLWLYRGPVLLFFGPKTDKISGYFLLLESVNLAAQERAARDFGFAGARRTEGNLVSLKYADVAELVDALL